jgi:lipopolysaccharide export system protein LptA
MTGRSLLTLAFVLAAGVALAQSPKATKDGAALPNAFQGFQRDNNEPVTIEADSLEIHDKERYAVFIGNVMVKQGDSVMRSRELKVHYEGSMREKDKGTKGATVAGKAAGNDPAQRIRRIEALGGVIVTSQDQKATGDRGVFDMPSNTATIIGNVVVSQGPNVMRAERLVVDMKTGLARMEAGAKDGKTRVQGLFLPSSIEDKKAPAKK